MLCRSSLVGTLVCALCALLGLFRTAAADSNADNRGGECPIMDRQVPVYRDTRFGFTPAAETTAPGWDKVSVGEVGLWGDLIFWENDMGFDFLMQIKADTLVLQGFDGSDSGYPLSMIRGFFQFSQRFVDGYGLRLDAAPGLYSSLNSVGGDDFALPFGATFIKAFTPAVALQLGASVYPQFDQVVDPRVGLRFCPGDGFLLDLAYPESALVISPTRWFHLLAGGQIRRWPEYYMGDDDARERLMYRDMRAYAGLAFDIGATRITFTGGPVLDREISFKNSADKVEMEDAIFGAISLSGLL